MYSENIAAFTYSKKKHCCRNMQGWRFRQCLPALCNVTHARCKTSHVLRTMLRCSHSTPHTQEPPEAPQTHYTFDLGVMFYHDAF